MATEKRKTSREGYLPPDKYLNVEQVNQLRRSLQDEANRARQNGTRRGLVNYLLVELMLESGLRAGDVCSLQLRDLPTYHGKDSILIRQGKGGVLRVINIKQSMRGKLEEYIRLCRKSAKPGSPLFVTEAGTRLLKCRVSRKGKITEHVEKTSRLSYHSLYMIIKLIGKRAGLTHLYPHMLRHTFASFLYKTKKDLRYTQQQMGHSRPEITARYAQVFDDDARKQTEALYSQMGGS